LPVTDGSNGFHGKYFLYVIQRMLVFYGKQYGPKTAIGLRLAFFTKNLISRNRPGLNFVDNIPAGGL